MHRVSLLTVAAGLLLSVQVPAFGQANPFASGAERYYKGGSARVTLTGAFDFDGELPLDPKASYTSDDGQTWIVYGDQTPGELNVIFTYSEYGYGLGVSDGSRVAMAEEDMCEAELEVTPTTVTGRYTCPSVDSGGSRVNMAPVSITIEFTAGS